MQKPRLYVYDKCSTCRNAIKFLERHKLAYQALAIVEAPPSKAELQSMLKYQHGEIKRLLNTSGQLYREMRLSEKLPQLSSTEVLELLAKHGKLIKRPFLLLDNGGLLGFREVEWRQALL